MDIIHIRYRLRCVITRSKYFECMAGNRYSEALLNTGGVFNMEIDENGIFLDRWYLMVLTTQDKQATLSIYDKTFQRKRRTIDPYQDNLYIDGPLYWRESGSFSYFISSSVSIQDIYIGLHYRERFNGFEGSIRNVQILKRKLYWDYQVKNAAFSYLYDTSQVYF